MKRLAALALLALAIAFAGLASDAAEYGDVKLERKLQGADDVPPAHFPHWIHRMQYKCGACHDEPFKMKAGATEITMDAIKSGQSCGVCHNGKTAFEANFDTCLRCHVK